MPKFKEFISEDKDEKLFCKILIITDEPEEAKTFHTADRLKQEAEKLKVTILSLQVDWWLYDFRR